MNNFQLFLFFRQRTEISSFFFYFFSATVAITNQNHCLYMSVIRSCEFILDIIAFFFSSFPIKEKEILIFCGPQMFFSYTSLYRCFRCDRLIIPIDKVFSTAKISRIIGLDGNIFLYFLINFCLNLVKIKLNFKNSVERNRHSDCCSLFPVLVK